MKPRLLSACFLAAATVAAWTGCDRPEPPVLFTGLARVGGQVISPEAVRERMARRQAGSAVPLDAAERAAVLDEFIVFEAAYARAREAGFDQTPAFRERLRRLIATAYLEEREAAQGPEAVFAEPELAAFHAAHPERYTVPARVRASLLHLRWPSGATPESRGATRHLAGRLRDEARTDEDFARLARRHSDDRASRAQGGDLGWLGEPAIAVILPPEVGAELARLRATGEVTPIVETSDGLHLVRLTGREPARLRPLAEVRELVRHHAARDREEQRRQALHAALKQGLDIEINPAALAELAVPGPAFARQTAPPALSAH